MFDDSINLVIWGHEHDCRIVPEPVAGKDYFITQPGSSVATSLSEGESLEKYVHIPLSSRALIVLRFRHVALVEIRGKEFQLTPLPLRTVRPFVMDEIQLTSAAEDEGFDANDQIAVSAFLKSKVM
jgi:double-strand break repair protein MRE11